MLRESTPEIPRLATSGAPVQWGALVGIAALLFSFATAILGQTAILVLAPHLYKQDMLAAEMLGYQFLALGVAGSAFWLLVVKLRARPEVLGFQFPGWQKLLSSASVGIAAVFIGVPLLYLLFSTLFPSYQLQGNAKDLIPSSLKHMGSTRQLLVLIWASVEVPLTEETLFRGILFQGLRHTFERWIPQPGAVLSGACGSGIVFGIAHLEPHTLPIIVLVGIVLAYVFHHARSLYASALVHGTINGIMVYALLHSS